MTCRRPRRISSSFARGAGESGSRRASRRPCREPLLEPVVGVGLVVERVDLGVAGLAVERDRLGERAVRLEPDDGRAGVPAACSSARRRRPPRPSPRASGETHMRFSSAGSAPWNLRAPQPTGRPRRRATSSRPAGGVRSSRSAGDAECRIEAALEALRELGEVLLRCTSARRPWPDPRRRSRSARPAAAARPPAMAVTSRARRCSSSGSSMDWRQPSDSGRARARSAAPALRSAERADAPVVGGAPRPRRAPGPPASAAACSRSPESSPRRRRSSRTSVPPGPISQSSAGLAERPAAPEVPLVERADALGHDRLKRARAPPSIDHSLTLVR